MARTRRPAGLPDFENPPVVEVVLSIQFEALSPIQFIDALSSFRARSRGRYPLTEQHPPLPPAFEIFGASPAAALRIGIQIQTVPDLPRFWMLNEAGTEIVQIQTDRFAHNWRKVGQGDEYPRYERIRRTFLDEYSKLNRFAVTRLGRELVPNQCEVTYVNHIDMAEALDTLKIVDLTNSGPELQGKVEGIVAQFNYLLPKVGPELDNPAGRLYVQVGAAVTRTGEQVFQLMLTARGRPLSPDMDGAHGFMDIGRQAVVRNFAALTTERMHRAWGRRN